MHELFIVLAGTTYGSGVTDVDDINSLASGALACFDNLGALIAIGAPYAGTADNVFFSVGGPTGENNNTGGRIDRNIDYELKQYVAPQAKIMAIGADITGANGYGDLNLPATIAEADVAGVYLYDLTKEHWDESRKKLYEVTATASDTYLTLFTRLVALINADTDAVADATLLVNGAGTVPTGIYLAGHTAGENFEAIVTGIAAEADTHEPSFDIVAGQYGEVYNGTYYTYAAYYALTTNDHYSICRDNIIEEGGSTQIAELENYCSVERGNQNCVRGDDKYTVSVKTVAGQTYDVITIKSVNDDKKAIKNGGSLERLTQIAIPVSLRAAVTTPLCNNVLANL